MHPIDLLKLCGVDMSKPQVIQEALDVFDGLLAQF
jgi:oligoendopeptidase F